MPKQVISTSSNGSGTAKLYLIAKNAQEQTERDKKLNAKPTLLELLTPIHQKVKQIVLAQSFEQDLIKTAETGKENHIICEESVPVICLSDDVKEQNHQMSFYAGILEAMLLKEHDIRNILENDGRSIKIQYRSTNILLPDREISHEAPCLSVSIDFTPKMQPMRLGEIVTPQEKKKKCNLL